MKEVEALKEIQRMSIDEKLAALSQTDKAYIRGYVERAIYDSRKKKNKVKAVISKNETKGK
jgi:hypothetical protein